MTNAPATVVTGADIPGINLGLLSSMPRVDLMPPEIAEKEALQRLQLGCAAALVACAVAVGSVWWQAHSTVNDAKKNLATTEAQKAAVNSQVAKLAPVAAQFAAVENGNRLVQQALGGEVLWSKQLRDLSTTIPANVWLTNMTVTASGTAATTTGSAATGSAASGGSSAAATPTSSIATITYQGTATSRYDIANWLTAIGGLKGYVGSTYTSSQEKALNGQVVTDFVATVQVTTDALSGRYTHLVGS